MDILGILVNILKLSKGIIAAIFLSSLLFTILSPKTIEALGLTQFLSLNKQWISLSLILTGSITALEIIPFAYKIIRTWRESNIKYRRLRNLTKYEKKALCGFLLNNERNHDLTNVPSVLSLAKEGIISSVDFSKVIGEETYYSYYISEWVWNYFKKHPEQLLDTQQLAAYKERANENPEYKLKK